MQTVTTDDARVDVEGFGSLAELALDLQCSWHHATDSVWQRLDPMLWELTHNPSVVLQTISRYRLAERLGDPDFRRSVDQLLRARREAARAPGWFRQTYPDSVLKCVAYFSMEFMLSEALPIYAGGLGNVAGDQMKAASDLGVPVVGIGLLYSQGYFRQMIDDDGTQQAIYPYNDPGQLPIIPLRRPNGEWLRLELGLPGQTIWVRTWVAVVGNVRLYLLDSNDAANFAPYRSITAELYGGTPEVRLLQELILGIGGWRLLNALGIAPDVCHLNEGHAALAVLERARSFMQASGRPFDVALAATRPGNLFTTHTAVSAGFDRFMPSLMKRCLGDYAQTQLGLTLDEFLALGRRDPHDGTEPFNMAYLAIRGSGAVNGVSRLHGRVSRELFEPLFPRWPRGEVPIGHVTNGVHMPSWDSGAADELWTRACGKERWRGSTEGLEQQIRQVSDEAVWQLRTTARQSLVEYARRQLLRQLTSSGAAPAAIAASMQVFRPDALTLGFARRFVEYKRPDLLLHDPERLLRLLRNSNRPVQLILAGKAHPADVAGQVLIQRWIRFISRTDARDHVIFLSDYDILLAEQLVQGVDVWINTPRRPWEASGTSGMKVLVNGGVNLSELDGWWAEAYTPEVGWAVGDGQDHADGAAWDAAEADRLYGLLEQEVVPQFYDRDAAGLPRAWLHRIRESMARLTPHFSSNRVVREYTEKYYLPAATRCRERSADRGTAAAGLAGWLHTLPERWATLSFGRVRVTSERDQHRFDIELWLGDLGAGEVQVELYANASANRPEERRRAEPTSQPGGFSGVQRYRAEVPALRPAGDYTARAMPYRVGVTLPLEAAAISWQR